jgi:hypothetical protein
MAAAVAAAFFGDAIPASESQTESVKVGENKKEKISPFDAGFAKLVETTLAKWNLPGVALAVVDGEETFAEVFIQQPSYGQRKPDFINRDTASPTYQMYLSSPPLSSAQEAQQSHLPPPQLRY